MGGYMPYGPAGMTPSQEAQYLRSQTQALQAQLEELEARLGELEDAEEE
jgi:prefoldin subunit 5